MENIDRRAAHVTLTFWAQWMGAMAVTLGLLAYFTYNKMGYIPPEYRILGVLTLLLSIPVYAGFDPYRRQRGVRSGLGRVLAAWFALLSALAAIAFVTKVTATFSREVILSWVGSAYVAQACMFVGLNVLAQRHYRRFLNRLNSLIIGTGPLARELALKVTSFHEHEPLQGFVSTEVRSLAGAVPADEEAWIASLPAPVLGSLNELRGLINQHDIQRVYIALPSDNTHLIESLYIDLLDANVDILWVPDLANLLLLNHSVRDLAGMPTISLNESPLTANPTSAVLKSALDRLSALLGLLALAPLLLVVALLIKMSSPGPVLFKQDRHGWNGRVFQVYKFRSMRMHDDDEVKQATRNDDRITPIGRFIRRTSIDELPQLINVLRGEMSLVGPRPHAVQHNTYYSDKILAYMARHRIKPGITGLAQVNGCRGETETIEKMAKRVELDLDYINNWSLWLDIKILLKTPFTLLSKDIY